TAAGIAHWRAEVSPAAIRSVAATADVVVVSLHGGTEYSSTADRFFSEVVQSAVDAGATIVWGHGPHVVQPVEVVDSALVATSLGNFIFDQPFPGTYDGVILEVLVTEDGVAAFRLIRTEHRDKRVHLVGADPPVGAAAFISGEWWNLVRPIEEPTRSRSPVEGFRWGDVIDSDHGDLDGNGSVEAVVAFTRPYIPNPVTRLWSDHPWVDAEGQTTHVGVFGSDGYRKVWVAGSVPVPIEGLVVCGGTVGLDQRDGLVALRWSGFGFVPAQVLPGARAGGCGDVDGDGVLDLIAAAEREPVSSRQPADRDGYSRAAERDR
ncbi:MAG: CapA family protein, partial [Acidimicrobiia bacterium]|nr:CapA family protein [Acidimicrobiia bacterium]